jgi:hypothetical protein
VDPMYNCTVTGQIAACISQHSCTRIRWVFNKSNISTPIVLQEMSAASGQDSMPLIRIKIRSRTVRAVLLRITSAKDQANNRASGPREQMSPIAIRVGAARHKQSQSTGVQGYPPFGGVIQ